MLNWKTMFITVYLKILFPSIPIITYVYTHQTRTEGITTRKNVGEVNLKHNFFVSGTTSGSNNSQFYANKNKGQVIP